MLPLYFSDLNFELEKLYSNFERELESFVPSSLSLILRVLWLPQVAACTLILESPSSKWRDHPTIPPSSWAFSSPSFLLFLCSRLTLLFLHFQFGNSISFEFCFGYLISAVHLCFFFNSNCCFWFNLTIHGTSDGILMELFLDVVKMVRKLWIEMGKIVLGVVVILKVHDEYGRREVRPALG